MGEKRWRHLFYLTVASGCSSIFLPCFRCPPPPPPPPPPTGVAEAFRGRALRSSQYVYLPLLSATHPWQEETFTSLHIAHRELNSTEPLRNHISLLLLHPPHPPPPPPPPPDWSAANNLWTRGCLRCNQCGIPLL